MAYGQAASALLTLSVFGVSEQSRITCGKSMITEDYISIWNIRIS